MGEIITFPLPQRRDGFTEAEEHYRAFRESGLSEDAAWEAVVVARWIRNA